MKIKVINGPNINLLGIREPDIYGTKNYSCLIDTIRDYCKEKNVEVSFFQSNSEGAIIDEIQSCLFNQDGIIINPAAYSHTSIGILDALKAVQIPTVEVHISDVKSRESFRQTDYVSLYAEKQISGLGIDGYLRAIDYLLEK